MSSFYNSKLLKHLLSNNAASLCLSLCYWHHGLSPTSASAMFYYLQSCSSHLLKPNVQFQPIQLYLIPNLSRNQSDQEFFNRDCNVLCLNVTQETGICPVNPVKSVILFTHIIPRLPIIAEVKIYTSTYFRHVYLTPFFPKCPH